MSEQNNVEVIAADDNVMAFTQLLEKIESNTFTQRDKGTDFERVSQVFFQKDKAYSDLFTKVQTYSEWAEEHPEYAMSRNDIGIDLMATNNMDNVVNSDASEQTYTAIQCKFYGQGKTVSKGDIDSFLAASSKKFITARYLVATNDHWTKNVNAQLEDQNPPVIKITRETLANSTIDWNEYLNNGGSKVVVNKRTLRPYQEEAIQNVIDGFKTNSRGKLIMACGTGKTFTSLKAAERQVGQHGFVLFLVPSLALLSQTLSDWKQQSDYPITAFAVCSDSKIGKKSSASNDSADLISDMSELAFNPTTDAESLAKYVNRALKHNAQDSNAGMTVVFSTYQSLEVIALAQNTDSKSGAVLDNPMPEFDLIICDEAHRTAGGYATISFNKGKVQDARELTPLELSSSLADDSAVKAELEKANLENENHEIEVLANSSKAAKKSTKKGSKLSFIDEEEAVFTRVHNNDYVHGKKRLYMTATPKIYGENAKKQEKSGEVVLYSMDDEAVFGPVFHSLNFDQAVKLDCLVDYKVIVLVCDRNSIPQSSFDAEEFSKDFAPRIVGTWKALNKYGIKDELIGDPHPMRRAVGFAQQINKDAKGKKISSKELRDSFQPVVDCYRNLVLEASETAQDYDFVKTHDLYVSTEHIDGSMDAAQKSTLLNWLREEPKDDECKVLFNVRCLSEGVDVPSLDAVIFLSPRKSQVEVVQIVGRVMRKAKNKKRGYVILPIVADDPNNLDSLLARSDNFDVVWQVLRALKSINPNHVIADPALMKLDDRIEVVCRQDDFNGGSKSGKKPGKSDDGDDGTTISKREDNSARSHLLEQIEGALTIEDKIKAHIIKKIGNARTWEDWAEDVAEICQRQVKNIKNLIEQTSNLDAKSAFASFKDELSCTINGHHKDDEDSISDDEVIEMLAQHIVIKPVLDELFKGYPFTEQNPIASALTYMLNKLNECGLELATNDLKSFYDSVGFRMKNVTSVEDRQRVIVDLFDRFFKVAFPKLQEKLGIVYTPIEVVDFINHSVNDILKQEFGVSLATQGVHILDPFTGTGTFITRMMQDEELIPREALSYKYRHDLHAFELVPLAYYVASINMESVYEALKTDPNESYQTNSIMVLTDTFTRHDEDVVPLFKTTIMRNTSLRHEVESKDLRVIIGNPPYSVGQKSGNDDNQNEHYPDLEARLEDTYVKRAGKITLKNSLYDSYIKAFRWASDKLGDSGVVAFVSNAGWIEAASALGMRKCLAEEFSSIYVYHLKGKQVNVVGEESRKEGGKIFGGGSRTPIAITLLVKNPQAQKQGKIYFGCVEDYLSREQKLTQLAELKSITAANLSSITPDEHGDWLNQRRNDFAKFVTVDGKKNDFAVFNNYSLGLYTSRDSWSYNSSKKVIIENFNRCIGFYNEQLDKYKQLGSSFEFDNNFKMIKWDDNLKDNLRKGVHYKKTSNESIVYSIYRPFVKQYLYNEKLWICRTYQMPKLFPYSAANNILIGTSGVGAKMYSALAVNSIPCLDFLEKSQWFPRFVYRKAEMTDDPSTVDTHGYVRESAIKDEAIKHFRAAYGEHGKDIDADAIFYYIYGILHSKDYRETYANNLQKELARIPRVANYEQFKAFEEAGRKLADLHVNYEKVEPYSGCKVEGLESGNYRVTQLSYGKIAGKKGNDAKDKTVIQYNGQITISNIPLETQEYVVNKRSALDWLIDRCCISQDKDSGIVNDYNNYAQEIGDEKYIFNLILRVITVSLETMKIVKALPKLEIHELDKQPSSSQIKKALALN